MARNPDNYFVLHGRKTPVRGKDTTYLTNTERTLSTRNLSQTSLSSRPGTRNSLRSSGAWTGRQTDFSEGGERLASTADADFGGENPYERIQEGLRSRNSELSLDLRSLNSSFSKSLNKSVTFSDGHGMRNRPRDEDEHSLDDMFEEELERLIMNDTMELNDPPHKEENLAGKPTDFSTSQWYVEPVHLTKEAAYPVFESLGAKEQRVSSVRRTTGMLGTEMAQKKVSSSISLEEEVKKYFPVTFGEVPSVMQTLTPPPPMDSSTRNAFDRTARSIISDASRSGNQGVMNVSSSRKPMSASGRLQTRNGLASSVRTSKGHRRGFPENGLSLRLSQGVATHHDPQVKAVKDYNYLKASQQFVDQEVVASPFEYELAKLRMERLRLEEQRILDIKRQEELERIRGPEPKWYELKTPKFTYEHAKNNQLNSSRKDWQGLFDYRTALLSASHEFSKTAT